jgi:DnaJ-class molecular chaperone
MPILDSTEKGNLYINFKVKIPEFTSDELSVLEEFFNKRK